MSMLPSMDSASLLPCELKNPNCPLPIQTSCGGGGASADHALIAGMRTRSAAGMKRCVAMLNALRKQVANLLEQHFGSGRRRRRSRYRRCRLLEFIDALDAHEQHDRNDGEIKNRLKEGAVLDEHGLAGGVGAESDGQIGEIHAANDFAERRHDDIPDQRGDYLSECCADDDTDRQVDDVSLH